MNTNPLDPDPAEIDLEDESPAAPVKANGLPGGPGTEGFLEIDSSSVRQTVDHPENIDTHASGAPRPAMSPHDFPGGDEEDRTGYEGSDRRTERSAVPTEETKPA